MSISAVSRNAVPDPAAAAQASPKADTGSKAARPTPPAGRGAQPPRPASGTQKTSATSNSSSSAKIYDKREINKDGKVSAKEIIQYAMKHSTSAVSAQSASQTAQKQSAAVYDKQGKISDNTNLLKGNIDTSI